MPINRRKHIDCFYYLHREEIKELPYKIYPRGSKLSAVSLSECYENPAPLMEIFRKRLNAPLDYGSCFNPIECFGYQFFLINSENQELTFFHPNQNKLSPQNDFLLLNNLINLQGAGIYKNNNQPKPDHTMWESSLQCEAIFEEDKDNLCIVTRRLKSSDSESKLLFNIAKDGLKDFSGFPTFLNEMMNRKVQPALIEERKEYPLRKIIEEAKSCLEDSIIFAHYIYNEFVESIKKRPIYHPQEVLSCYLTNPHIINISRVDLLNFIKQKYPFYEYPKLLENTILTNFDWGFSPLKSETINNHSFEFEINVHGEKICIRETILNQDIKKYIDNFNMCVEVFHMKSSVKIIPDELIAVKILEELPCFHSHWHNQPKVTAVDFESFWAKRGELRYALYDPPYGTTGQDIIALFDENFISLLFCGKPPKEWLVFSSSTDNEYFINEWWDYLWIAFNKNGDDIIVIAATATD